MSTITNESSKSVECKNKNSEISSNEIVKNIELTMNKRGKDSFFMFMEQNKPINTDINENEFFFSNFDNQFLQEEKNLILKQLEEEIRIYEEEKKKLEKMTERNNLEENCLYNRLSIRFTNQKKELHNLLLENEKLKKNIKELDNQIQKFINHKLFIFQRTKVLFFLY